MHGLFFMRRSYFDHLYAEITSNSVMAAMNRKVIARRSKDGMAF